MSANNATGFSAVPAGLCNGSSFTNAGLSANFWSSSKYEYYPHAAWRRSLYHLDAGVASYDYTKHTGYSVRCLRD